MVGLLYLFLAPEQTHRNGAVDQRTDIHAVGALVYFLMTGRPPFEGASPNDTVAKIRQAEVEKTKELNSDADLPAVAMQEQPAPAPVGRARRR